MGKYHLLDARNILCNVSRKWGFIGPQIYERWNIELDAGSF